MADESVTGPIVAALKAGNRDEAEHFCRAALARDPQHKDALLLLALTLQSGNRTQEALEPLARLTELYPKDSASWSNYATVLHQLGQLPAAREAAERSVALAPEDRDELERLGQWATELGAPHAAAVAFQRALDQGGDSAKLRIAAARARVAAHDILAGEAVREWRHWPTPSDDELLQLAELLAEVSETWDAFEILQQLVARRPTDWSAQLLLAKVSERVNQPREAASRLDWIEAMQPGTPESDWIRREIDMLRAQLAMRARDYLGARNLLEKAGPAGDRDASYYFALARACDRLGDTAATVAALHEAHRLQREALGAARPGLLEPDASLLPGVDDRVTEAEYRAWPTLRAPSASESPVFVVGFPRSGTTLLEQMLDAHPRLQSMDERPFLNMLAANLHDFGVEVPHDLGRLDQRDCDELRKGYVLMGCSRISRRWDAQLVDKNPLNMLWLPLLHRIFPDAKVILALRHPCDVIWSCYLQNFRAAALQAACRSLEHLGRAYVAAMENWLHHSKLFDVDVFVSRFEDLVADPAGQARRIADFLGVGDSDSMLGYADRAREKGFIKTPSYTQVVEPINARGVGHWLRHREAFETVLPIVQPMLEHWQYESGPE